MIAAALRRGLADAGRRWRIAVALYACNLLAAAVLVLPLASLIERSLGRSTAAEGLDATFRFGTLLDFLRGSEAALRQQHAVLGAGVLVYALLSSILTGGALDLLRAAPRSPFLPRFLGSAGKHAFRFLRLLAYLGAALGLVWLAGRGLDRLIAALFDQSPHEVAAFWAMRGKQAVILLLLLGVAALFDLARVLTVLEDRVHMIGALRTAAGFLLRHAGGVLLLYALLLALHLLLFVPYLLAAHVWLPAASIVLLLAAQQFLVLLRHFLRVAGFAALLACYRSATGATATEGAASATAGPGTAEPRDLPSGTVPAGSAFAVAGLAVLAFAAGAGAAPRPPEAPVAAAVASPGAGTPLSRRVVHYDIDARLDPAARTIAGRETIVYRNLTTGPMREMPFHLYPNAFSGTHSVYMRGTPWDDEVSLDQLRRMERDATWGHMRILSVAAGDGADLTAAASIDDTVMTVPLPRPVPPGESVTLHIAWETLLPRTFHRMGVWGEHFDVMQWYPKPGVFTDAGWKMYPFHRRSEFFADFGTFAVTLTVPARFRVEATGLPADAVDQSDGTRRMTWRALDVHDFAWVADPRAEVSRLVVAEGPYAGSPVEVIYIHPASRTRSAPRVLEAARHGLLYYGERFLPYPYPRMVIDGLPMGLGGGMEYPMLFTVSMAWFLPRFYDAPEELTLHEFGHQYWYGLLASNEFEEPWLDEGINSYVTQRALETLRPPRPGRTVTALEAYAATRVLHEGLALPLLRLRPDLDWLFGFAETPFRPTERGLVGTPLSPYALDLPGLGEGSFLGAREGYAEAAQDDPLTAPSWGIHPGSYSAIVYDKTQVVMTTLERLLGREVIDAALGDYARRYRFAHPTGDDFVGVLRETARRDRPDVDLGPLLEALFHGTGTIDFAVASLRSREARPPRGLLPPARAGEPPIDRRAAPAGSAGAAPAPTLYETEVIVRRLGDLPVPVDLLVRFADGSETRERWDGTTTWKRYLYERPARAERAVVDPEERYALDLDRNNNGLFLEPRHRPAARLSLLALFWVQNLLMLAGSLV